MGGMNVAVIMTAIKAGKNFLFQTFHTTDLMHFTWTNMHPLGHVRLVMSFRAIIIVSKYKS